MARQLPKIRSEENLTSDFDDLPGGFNSSMQQIPPLDILIKNINNDFVIEVTKETRNIHATEAKTNCKIMKFSLDSNLDEIAWMISKLNADEYPNLFIFIIESDNFEILCQKDNENLGTFELVKSSLINFDANRPIVLKIRSKNENVTKFFYKDGSTEKLLTIDQQNSNFQSHKGFPTLFMMAMNGTIDIEELKADDLIEAKNSCLILKFLRTFQLSEGFLVDLILSCGEIGTPDQLLASLDDPFGSNGKMLDIGAQEYLSQSITFPNDVELSVLLGSVENKNKKIVSFLIENFSHLIQQLPHDHKIDISTAAFQTNQIDVLCDLLKYSDFPFPKDFDSESVNNEEMLQIVDDRQKFHDAIVSQDTEAIEKFIDANQNSKLAFDTKNKSALSHAFTCKGYDIFFQLKSLGFQATVQENVDYENSLKGEELKKARKAASRQMHKNVLGAKKTDQRSVMIMLAKSTISNRKLDNETEAKHRQKIQKWFEDIYKTKFGRDLIDAAAQCDQLNFIFDFECKTISNIRLQGKASASAFPNFKWIMIGAKTSKENSEQQIKGAIAHELCHYVMRIVFENKDRPYYKKDSNIYKKYDQVVKDINKWTNQNPGNKSSSEVDDECDGIISTVFTLYDEEYHHLELIVRVAQIYAKFDNDKEKVEQLEIKYEKLFDFYALFVVPEMRKLCSKNRKFNKIIGLLPQIESSELELETPKDLPLGSSSSAVIAVTNVPKLLFVDVYKKSCAVAQKPFIDDKNLFLTSHCLDISGIVDEFESIQREKSDMNIFVDCTKEIGCNLQTLFINKSQKIFFIVKSESRCQELKRQLHQINEETQESAINFNWINLTMESQRKLTKIDFDFQMNRASIYSLMTNEDLRQEEEVKVASDLAEIVDDQLLDLLVEKSNFSVNTKYLEDLSNDISFILLFQQRKLIQTFENNSANAMTKFSHEELIVNIKNQKYILISDIAGSGKSWTLKSITKYLQENFQTCWVTYVDLKQFISAFKSMTTDTSFLTFMLENVLKDHQKFEAKIFKKLYEIGKVFVLFDGFDEISPNYCEIVVGIIKSFESNGGNQMWIATRDYYEVDLKEQLELDVAYKLDEFTEQDGIDLISSIWVLNELGNDLKADVKPDVIETSPNYKLHQEQAKKLMEKLSRLQFKSIGFPQFYKMTAEVFKENKFEDKRNNLYEIYKDFALIQIERWSHEKGEVRKKDSAVAQAENSSFMEVHQILAMKSLFPDDDELCDLEYDDEIWSAAVIVGCGLVTKNDENFSFFHETFREFFAANFIFGQLKKGSSNFINFFIKFFTHQKYEVIRMFLNDALADEHLYKKISSKVKKMTKEFTQNINGSENISFAFGESIGNVGNFLIDLLKNSEYENVKEILEKNTRRILKAVQNNEKLLVNFVEFLIGFLKTDDLRQFLTKHSFIQCLVISKADAEFVLEVIFKINEKTCSVRDVLKSENEYGRNFFIFLCSYIGDVAKFRILFEALSTKYFSSYEMVELLQQCSDNGRNILYYCVDSEKEEKFKFVWEKLEKIFPSQNLSQNFKELLKQKDSNDNNCLYYAAVYCKEINFHETFWELLLKTVEIREEIKELILEKNEDGENFVHTLAKNVKPEIIEFSLKKFKENFSDDDFQEILMSKCEDGRNLLQTAVECLTDINVHQILWKTLRNFLKPDEKLIKMICDDDDDDDDKNNILYLAAKYSKVVTEEIFEFLIQQSEISLSCGKIKQMLSASGKYERNILHLAADNNKSQEFHQLLWNVLKNYFEPSEIFNFIIHKDWNGQNFVEVAVDRNTPEIVKFHWNEIKMLLNSNGSTTNEIQEVVRKCDDLNEDLSIAGIYEFKIEFYKIAEFLKLNFKEETLLDLTECKNIEVFKFKWVNCTKNFENIEELKKYLIRNSLMNEIVRNCELEVVKFTFENLEIVFCESDFLEIFLKLDEYKENIIQAAISSSSYEVFEFLIQKLKIIGTRQQIKQILLNLDYKERNLLQIALESSNQLKLHVTLWKRVHEFFNTEEIFKLLTYCVKDGRNVILIAIEWSSQDILELTWNGIKANVTDTELMRIVEHRDSESKNILYYCVESAKEEKLKFIWREAEEIFASQNLSHNFKELLLQKQDVMNWNILHCAAVYCKELKFYEIFWEILLKTVQDKNELKELIMQTNKYEENFIHTLVEKGKPEVIEFSLKILQEKFNVEEFQRILMSKCEEGSNLLHLAAKSSKEIEGFKIVWEFLKKFFDSNEIFMQILGEVDDYKWNIFHYSTRNDSCEIIDFISEEVEKIASKKEIKKLLSTLDTTDRNLLHLAAYQNSSSDFHDSLWKIIGNYFNHSEIHDMLYHRDIDGKTILMTCSLENTKEIVELTWTMIQKFIEVANHVKYLMIKDYKMNGLLKFSQANSEKEVYEWIELLMKKHNLNVA